MSGKRYTDEFKFEAAKQVVERGRSIREVSGRRGISIDSPYVWGARVASGGHRVVG